MSAFTSSIALSWSGVSWYGNASSSSRCHGVSSREGVAGRVQRASGRARRAPARSRCTVGADAGLGLLPVASRRACDSVGVVAAGVVADGVDLVGRDVELVVAAVLEQEVVALDAADGARDHPAVAGDAVLVVHDVVAGLEVVEERARRRVRRGRGPAVGAAPAGEVGLGQHRQLDAGQDEAPLERPRPRTSRSATAVGRASSSRDREPRRCRRRRRRRRPGSRRRCSSRELVDERGCRRRRPGPTRRLDGRDVGRSRARSSPSTPAPRCGASSRSKGRCRCGNVAARGHAPRRRARCAARSASSARMSAARSRMRRGSISRTCASSGSRSSEECSPSASHGSHDSMPSNVEALGEPLPLLAAPRLGADERARPGPGRRRSGSSSRQPNISTSGEVGRWSAGRPRRTR